MDQSDPRAAENILREMSAARTSLDEIADVLSVSKRTLIRRLDEDKFSVRELGLIAHKLNVRTADLVSNQGGAA